MKHVRTTLSPLPWRPASERNWISFRDDVEKSSPERAIRDKDLLGVLVFWQRLEYQRSNGRRKGRAFIESLYALLPPPKEETTGDSGGYLVGWIELWD